MRTLGSVATGPFVGVTATRVGPRRHGKVIDAKQVERVPVQAGQTLFAAALPAIADCAQSCGAIDGPASWVPLGRETGDACARPLRLQRGSMQRRLQHHRRGEVATDQRPR